MLIMEKLINYTREFVIRLTKIDTKSRNSDLKKYQHIDIELMKEDKINWIQITLCSLSDLNDFEWIDDVKSAVCKRTIENSDELILVLFKSNANDFEYIYDFSGVDTTYMIPRISSIPHNPYLKEYLAIRIMHKLKEEELTLFKKSLPQQLLNLNEVYPNLKYTFHCDNELLYNTSVSNQSNDEILISCMLLSSAIEKIIVSSTNDEFRQQCSQLLNTTQSGILNQVVFIKLFGLFNNNNNNNNNNELKNCLKL